MKTSRFQTIIKELELSAKPVVASRYAIFECVADSQPLLEVDLQEVDEHALWSLINKATQDKMYKDQVVWASNLPSVGFSHPHAKTFF